MQVRRAGGKGWRSGRGEGRDADLVERVTRVRADDDVEGPLDGYHCMRPHKLDTLAMG